jgi:hypothetical protein
MQQQDFCSCIASAFSGLRRAKFGLSSANRGWVGFTTQSIFEPGEPQRVNACGFFAD